jgi:tRNA U34 5-methylaminomethyl-2-thiouridine-forming methyltransferase MnmC
MWEYDLLSIVADKTVKGGTFATYTASGSVRRNLSQLGFNVAKVNGFGKKRHMLLGKKID